MYRMKEDPRSIQSKNMVYRALSQKIREKDFGSITIKEVVNAAQIGRTTFYRNFDNLESVLRWKCDEAFQELYLDMVQSLSPHAAQTEARKFPFLLPFFRYWQADSDLIEVLIAANRIDILLAAFESAMKKLVLKFHPAIVHLHPYFDYFLAFRTGAIISLLLKWIQNHKNLSPEEMYQWIEAQSEGFGLQM